MAHVAALSILALTVSLSLTRPALWRIRIRPATAAVIGGLLTVATGLVTLPEAYAVLAFLALPVLTIVSLMVITLIAEQAGIFRMAAWRIARGAKGDGRKLFAYLFFAGTLTGALFTNDAAVLIFTPLVYLLIEEVQEHSWTAAQKIPYYFAVLYVGNLVAPLVIGNPINIVVASWFNIGFLEYAAWMTAPALVSIVATYAGMRLFFRRSIPATYRVPKPVRLEVDNAQFMIVSAAVLLLTLVGFFTEHVTGIATGYIAAMSAAVLVVASRALTQAPLLPIVRGVGWGPIIFVAGIFLVATGLNNAGLTDVVGEFITRASGSSESLASLVTGFTASACSAVMNNHPVAGIMAMVIDDLPLTDPGVRRMALSALIGGDLGPKMLPIGSLAALLWFRMLRDRGVDISYWLYIKIGVPVTLATILLSLLTLNLTMELFAGLG